MIRYHGEIVTLQKGDILGHEVKLNDIVKIGWFWRRFLVYGKGT
jgi:hypothetical protein